MEATSAQVYPFEPSLQSAARVFSINNSVEKCHKIWPGIQDN